MSIERIPIEFVPAGESAVDLNARGATRSQLGFIYHSHEAIAIAILLGR